MTKQLFENALDKLQSAETTIKESDKAKSKTTEQAFLKESLMDLIRALIPYQSCDKINFLYEKSINQLSLIKNNKEQKKAYRLLEEICSCESESCKEFVKKNRKSIQKLLLKSLDTSAVSSKGARLRCFNYLLKEEERLDPESKFLRSVISEAVLCCKDINEKCRATAYNLLNTIGEKMLKHNDTDKFIGTLLAGLIGTPQMMSATILALTSILHHFSGMLGQDNIHCLLENITKLMAAPTREIVGSCLSFIKVYSTTLPSPSVAVSMPILVSTNLDS